MPTRVDDDPLTTSAEAAPPELFDVTAAWTLHRAVAVRPESFGALLYHFGTRRLTFLKDPVLVEVVRSLAHHSSAADAVLAAGVPLPERPRYAAALARLARTDMLVRREGAP